MSIITEDLTASAQVHDFQADNGLQIRVRPECPSDTALLVDLFDHMGPTSRYMRFGQVLDNPKRSLVEREARRLAELVPPQDCAWLALADLPGQENAPVAGVRYVRLAPGIAELAISVRDDMQRLSIGSRLLKFALDQARRDGIRRIVATFRSDNQAAWSILQYSPYHVTWEQCGVDVEVTIYLQPGS